MFKYFFLMFGYLVTASIANAEAVETKTMYKTVVAEYKALARNVADALTALPPFHGIDPRQDPQMVYEALRLLSKTYAPPDEGLIDAKTFIGNAEKAGDFSEETQTWVLKYQVALSSGKIPEWKNAMVLNSLENKNCKFAGFVGFLNVYFYLAPINGWTSESLKEMGQKIDLITLACLAEA